MLPGSIILSDRSPVLPTTCAPWHPYSRRHLRPQRCLLFRSTGSPPQTDPREFPAVGGIPLPAESVLTGSCETPAAARQGRQVLHGVGCTHLYCNGLYGFIAPGVQRVKRTGTGRRRGENSHAALVRLKHDARRPLLKVPHSQAPLPIGGQRNFRRCIPCRSLTAAAKQELQHQYNCQQTLPPFSVSGPQIQIQQKMWPHTMCAATFLFMNYPREMSRVACALSSCPAVCPARYS